MELPLKEADGVVGFFVIVGAVATAAYVGSKFLVKQLYAIIKGYFFSEEGSLALKTRMNTLLQQSDSELSMHDSNPNAHENMRVQMGDNLTDRFDKLEALIEGNARSQSAELNRFKEDALKPVVELSKRTLDVLEASVSSNEAKFMVKKSE